MSRGNPEEDTGEADLPEIDLHGMRPEEALRHLGRELHACRMRHEARVVVITGRGWGNPLQQPVLRPRVEEWLAGPEGRKFGVLGFEVTSLGGALLVRLRA